MKQTDEELVSQVPPGWRDLVLRLLKDLQEMGWEGDVQQIKEKFGELRFYASGTPEVFDRIDEATDESRKTCEICGAAATQVGEGWIYTLCPPHEEKRLKTNMPVWRMIELEEKGKA